MTRKKTPARTILSLSALALLITGSLLYAGPLNPPAGPVTSTGKTLTEVEPRTAINLTNTPGDADSVFRITLPGSYYLTGNVAALNKSGIEIAANNVTIDLMGFNIQAIISGLPGVSVDGTRNYITIRNGTVTGFAQGGIFLRGPSIGTGALIEQVLASGNPGGGIIVGNNAVVRDCIASNNTGGGIRTDAGCTVTNCSAYQNDGSGIIAGSGGTVSNCSATSNTGNGISTESGCTVSNCSAYLNTGSGISVSTGSSCTVADCTVRSNTLDGIVCSSGCVVRSNTCSFNGFNGVGAGIHATLGDNRIEGNNCTGADRGIDVDLAGNIIIKNTCSGNTSNWEIAVGNSVGPIVVAGTNAAIISGFGPAVSTLGSTDSNANFSY